VIPYKWRISNKLQLGYQQNEINKRDDIYIYIYIKKKEQNGGQRQYDCSHKDKEEWTRFQYRLTQTDQNVNLGKGVVRQK